MKSKKVLLSVFSLFLFFLCLSAAHAESISSASDSFSEDVFKMDFLVYYGNNNVSLLSLICSELGGEWNSKFCVRKALLRDFPFDAKILIPASQLCTFYGKEFGYCSLSYDVDLNLVENAEKELDNVEINRRVWCNCDQDREPIRKLRWFNVLRPQKEGREVLEEVYFLSFREKENEKTGTKEKQYMICQDISVVFPYRMHEDGPVLFDSRTIKETCTDWTPVRKNKILISGCDLRKNFSFLYKTEVPVTQFKNLCLKKIQNLYLDTAWECALVGIGARPLKFVRMLAGEEPLEDLKGKTEKENRKRTKSLEKMELIRLFFLCTLPGETVCSAQMDLPLSHDGGNTLRVTRCISF